MRITKIYPKKTQGVLGKDSPTSPRQGNIEPLQTFKEHWKEMPELGEFVAWWGCIGFITAVLVILAVKALIST